MQCKYCSKQIVDDSIYCSYCGREVELEREEDLHKQADCIIPAADLGLIPDTDLAQLDTGLEHTCQILDLGCQSASEKRIRKCKMGTKTEHKRLSFTWLC